LLDFSATVDTHVNLDQRHLIGYVNQLLAAFPRPAAFPHTRNAQRTATLVEPISERELEVLLLIAQGLTNREIGERLCVTLSTVKGHNQRLFGKLQAQNRTEAVTRARQLGLL
jgi:LuxR family maltose regulon positive regulatory protein